VPLALLDEPWLAGKRIVMLEPRRLATRAAAHRMADTLGERVGETVGYRIRMDSRVGAATRIEVVTEGILTRFLQRDPTLEGVGLVIFDEFHERSLHADLGLALTLQTKALLREDLRVLVMSATLDGAAVAHLLGDAPLISSEGRSFPVETRYLDRRADVRLEPAVVAAVRSALSRDEGDILVFLPGAAEIRRTQALLESASLGPEVRSAPLYGNLPQAAQDLAIEPSPPGLRKVVLATSIAETSLTIEGIGIVIDGGLSRVPRFSPRTGMTRLETVRVSRASADQRRGRAGRLGPGVCYRLWPEHEQHHLLPQVAPEILEADLAPLALELAAAGVDDPGVLAWLDPPPAAALSQARELLGELTAIDVAQRITPHGRRMAELALHPRLAHMVLEARRLELAASACELAALLGERDLFRSDSGTGDADIRLRLSVLRGDDQGRVVRERFSPQSPPRTSFTNGESQSYTVDRETLRRVRAEAERLMRQLRVPRDDRDDDAAGLLLAFAYPDRIGQQRFGQPGRFLLRNGLGAAFATPQSLSSSELLVAADVDGKRPESRIFLAAPLTTADLEEHFGGQLETETIIAWDREAQAVLARRRERLGALVLRDAPLRDPDPAAVVVALLDGIAQEGLGVLPWTVAARALQARLTFVRRLEPAWPDVSDATLAASLAVWLAPHVHGMRRRDDLRRLDLSAILLGMLDWRQRIALEEIAPTHITVPSGSRIPVDYADPAAPVLAVRLQEMFGLTETPAVGRGSVPVTLHLLSPAHRPVQVTRDLAGFWRSTYFEVRKDLKGRYPKHYWPDDPLDAQPTHRAKRRR
jgi:ATP-dependent RNA helicase HrpB